MRVVVALGGNALLCRGEKPESAIQREHVAEAPPPWRQLLGNMKSCSSTATGHK